MSKTAAAAEVGGLWPLSLREISELHAFCRGAAGRMLRSYSTQERIPPPLSQLTDFASSINSVISRSDSGHSPPTSAAAAVLDMVSNMQSTGVVGRWSKLS
jgi:hypothetical protein